MPRGRSTAARPPDRAKREGESVARAFLAVREAILTGRYKPGQPVSQVELAAELGLSRTPLREALRMLQREGLVRFEPNQRVRIPSLTVADVEGLYVMRIALEAIAIRLTLPAFGPRQIARLEELFTDMDRNARERRAAASNAVDGDALAWSKDAAHREFHALFVMGAGEPVAAQIAELSAHADRSRIIYSIAYPDSSTLRREDHRAMLDAAAAGDVDATVAALAAHYARTAEDVIAELDPRYVSARLATTVVAVGTQARRRR